MANKDSSVLNVSIDALQTTKQAAGWLISIAERSQHPDAEAAARWLDAMGERTYRLLVDLAGDVAKVVDDPLSKVTASAKFPAKMRPPGRISTFFYQSFHQRKTRLATSAWLSTVPRRRAPSSGSQVRGARLRRPTSMTSFFATR